MRNFAVLLLALPLLVGGQNPTTPKTTSTDKDITKDIRKLIAAPKLAPRVTSTAAGLTYQTYTVSDPLAFPSLPLPARSLVLRNGLPQTPGQDYAVSGTSFHFLSTIQLTLGDHVAVISGF